tara:strand:- start:2728 stop:4752 length:2025 start_codon:yes stop_codon:yes gene_type:complete
MAVQDFTGKNIQNTYQRIVQTDGTNTSDGTGSLLPISFDGNNVIISGSLVAHSYVVSESVTAVSSGSTIFGNTMSDVHQYTGSVFITGSISASLTGSFGRVICQTISASTGHFDEGTIEIGGEPMNKTLLQNIKDGFDDSTRNTKSNIALFKGGIHAEHISASLVSASEFRSKGHITASGNISASGNILARGLTITKLDVDNDESTALVIDNGIVGTRELGSNAFTSTTIGTVTNDLTVDDATLQLDSGTTYDGSTAKTISVKDGGIDSNALAADITVTTLTTTDIIATGHISASLVSASELRSSGHITASGNISASGFIYSATSSSMASRVATLEAVDHVNSALTVDNTTLQLNTGTTYNGASSRTISVKDGGIDSDALADDVTVTNLTTTTLQGVGGTTGLIVDGFISASGRINSESHISASGNISASEGIIGGTLKLTGLSADNDEATALVIDSGIVGTRDLGSNAFTSTTIGTNTNALTVDDVTLQLNTGTTFNGSAARTISVKDGGIDSDALAADIAVTSLTATNVTASQYEGNTLFTTGSHTSKGTTAEGDIFKFGSSDPTTAGDIYMLRSDAQWVQATAADETAATGSLAVATGGSALVGMLFRGMVKLDNDPDCAIGQPVFLSTTAGHAACAAPTSTNNIARIIGFYMSGSGTIYFNPDNTSVKVS